MTTSTDWSLIISLAPDAMREEFYHYVYMNETYPEKHADMAELSRWWLRRTDDEIAEMGYSIMEGSEIWDAFRREVERAMSTVKAEIEKREAAKKP